VWLNLIFSPHRTEDANTSDVSKACKALIK
jgi:hypothetical protein